MKMNRLLLAFILLTVIFTPAEALSDDFRYPGLAYRNTGGMTKLDTDFFTLMKRLKDDMPLTPQKIVDAGFELKSSRVNDWGLILTKINPVQLNDGTILAPIELHASVKMPYSNTFFTVSTKPRKFTHEDVARNFEEPKLVGVPMLHPKRIEYIYRTDIGKYNIQFYYTEQEPDILDGMSFDSSEEPPPPPPTGFYKGSKDSATP